MNAGRVAIFCNGVIPGSGIPNGAQGLRAQGLYLGLKSAGMEADIVCSANTVHSQLNKWNYETISIPGHFRIVLAKDIQERLNEDYGTVIMQNWAAFPEYQKGKGVRLVYDFFSPTMVEHSFIADADALKERAAQKRKVLAQADLFIANGTGRADYGLSYLQSVKLDNLPTSIASVRLSLPWSGRVANLGAPFRVFFGGFDQAWTKGLSVDDLSRLAEKAGVVVEAIGIGKHLHHDHDPSAGRAFANGRLHDGVTEHPVAAFEDYCALNARCHVALDVFESNEERRLSYSTRAITSLANGCPLITMRFTEIGELVAQTGAGWVMDELSVEALAQLLSHIREHPKELADKRRNTRIFWERYCDPEAEIRHLIEAVS